MYILRKSKHSNIEKKKETAYSDLIQISHVLSFSQWKWKLEASFLSKFEIWESSQSI